SHLEKDEYLNNIAELKTELSSLNQQIQVFNSRFTEIETTMETFHSDQQTNLQQLTELSNNQQNQNRELSIEVSISANRELKTCIC
ncbi:MAG: hypothetical protein ACKPEQ_26975, partial [Dolichospermum sp.]